MNSKKLSLLLSVLLLTGCTRSADLVRNTHYGVVPENTSALPGPDEYTRAPQVTPSSNEPEIISYSYEYDAALKKLKKDRLLPDGTSISMNSSGDIENTDFSITDIDGDNTEELMIRYNGSNTPQEDAGDEAYAASGDAFEAIYEYRPDTETFFCQLYEHRDILYYDNGTAFVPWSGSRDLSDGSSSRNIYEYDPVSDTYIYVGFTDCWDMDFAEKNSAGDPFPEELDKDGDHKLYALSYYSEYETGYIYDEDDLNRLLKKLESRRIPHPWRSI